MDFFHETRLVSIAQALMASILEIRVQCGMPLYFNVGSEDHKTSVSKSSLWH